MEPVKVPQIVYEQLQTVRESRRTNMANANGVQIVADRMNLYDLVVWVEDNRGTGKLGMGCLVGFEPEESER